MADIRAKLDAIGYEFLPITDWDAEPFEFSGEQVEALARREHGRWWNERLRSGWRLGPVRDGRAKLSPYLVPWEELGDDVRDLDRDTVRLIPSILATAGFAIVPLPGGASPGPASPAPATPVADASRPAP